jgi:uncharacterized membrane protein
MPGLYRNNENTAFQPRRRRWHASSHGRTDPPDTDAGPIRRQRHSHPKETQEMTKMSMLAASALVAALAVPAVAVAEPAAVPTFKAEKCFGVVKAGKNDCQTSNSSCAGTSRRDGQADAWIYVPAGSCERIVGGSLSPKA